jgi:hypothetical protein
MKFRWRFLDIVILIMIIVFGLSSLAGSQSLTLGVDYLISSQKSDGSWEGGTYGAVLP